MLLTPNKKRYLVNTIIYDYGSELKGLRKPKLPTEIIVEDVPVDIQKDTDELEEYLSNEISNKTGFCVKNFYYYICN